MNYNTRTFPISIYILLQKGFSETQFRTKVTEINLLENAVKNEFIFEE